MYDHILILLAVVEWQNNKNFHPLTCAIHSNAKLRVGKNKNGTYLFCPEKGCKYVQWHIPDVVIDFYKNIKWF